MSKELSNATKARYSKPQPYRGVIMRFPRAIMAIAEVSMFGTVKHEVPLHDMSYVDVPDAEFMYAEAEVRHLCTEAIDGPLNPVDNDLMHKAQKAWNALADLEVALKRAGMYSALNRQMKEDTK